MERVMSGLSAMERSKLVLDSYRFDTREDPLIRRMMPQRQAPAFNEAIYRMNAANMYIAQTINLLEADLDLLWSRWLLLHYVTLWQCDLIEIEEAVQQASRSNGPRGARGAQQAAQTPTAVSVTDLRKLLSSTPGQRHKDEDDNEALEELQESFSKVLVRGFGQMWPSLRAVEIVLEEFAVTFQGIDPLKPVHRKRLTAIRNGLEELAGALALFDLEVEWREPDAELLAWVRGTVPAMRILMGG